MTRVLIEPRWSYREAEKLLGKNRIAIAAVARTHGLECEDGKPLNQHGLIRVGELLGVKVEFADLARSA